MPGSKLTLLLRAHFSHNSQVRGAEYAARGQVSVVERGDGGVCARVQGTDTYDVKFTIRGGLLTLFCSCPHFEDFNPCKHIWAVALTIERDPLLSGWKGLEPREVEFDFPGSDMDGWDDLEEDDEDEPPYSTPAASRPAAVRASRSTPSRPAPTPPPRDPWRAPIEHLRTALAMEQPDLVPYEVEAAKRADADFLLVVDRATGDSYGQLSLELVMRTPKKNGAWSKPKTVRLAKGVVEALPAGPVRDSVAMLAGALREDRYAYGVYDSPPARFHVTAALGPLVLPALAASRLLALGPWSGTDPAPLLSWDDGDAWSWELALREEGAGFTFEGYFRRGEIRIAAAEAELVTRSFIAHRGALSPFDSAAGWSWISRMRATGSLAVAKEDVDGFLRLLFTLPELPPIGLPESLRIRFEEASPLCGLRLLGAPKGARAVGANLSFDYGGELVRGDAKGAIVYRADERRALRRDTRREREAAQALRRLGFQPAYEWRWGWVSNREQPQFVIEPERVPAAVIELVGAGWKVEGDGTLFRPFTGSRVSVTSGIDWFELRGDVEFNGEVVHAPELLAALARGERFVRLGDGSTGVLPEEWLRRFSGIAGFGVAKDDHVRFRPSQAMLLDALLASQPKVDVDAGFERARARLRQFTAVRPEAAPQTFSGTLRPYQEEGLGWLRFLREFGFGGCLADDMGLGKTVMVLALLDAVRPRRRSASADHRPSIVVAPKSVVFNWLREAERFAPGLRVADYTGIARDGVYSRLANTDLVVTTYGTLRRDVELFEGVEFEYVILDEAQAIKNGSTASAKAARLLRGRHRLALSGTPIENHAGELWSIFEFLNPGMLGSGAIFKAGSALRTGAGQEELRALGTAVRPFILRRTKSQVAKDLPPRQEETLWCELTPRERRLYDQLRAHYKAVLLGKIEKRGLGRAKLQVLEALLRLRQAACHPGLVDAAKSADGSAKLEVLLEQLVEVLAEGHKAIVFSQFTSLLALLRRRLDGVGLRHLDLDGQTRDRESLVRQFQEQEDPRLFLISLKAGGLGLNLTAADYVFLLDPWWNPAAEAQAIDRAHRIGQTRPVFAYRLIARDTVEERILELQQRKRQLADAIITEDNSVIANLTREELEHLLG